MEFAAFADGQECLEVAQDGFYVGATARVLGFDGDQDSCRVVAGGALGALSPAPAAGGDKPGFVAEDHLAGDGVLGFALAGYYFYRQGFG